MRDFDWKNVVRGKDAYRDQIAGRPFAEKLRMLDRLRERSVALSGHSIPLGASPVAGVALNVSPSMHVVRGTNGTVNLSVFGASATFVSAIAPMQSGSTALTTFNTLEIDPDV